MITKEQLQAMSDFEVNKALAYSAGMSGVWRDYCNNPSDIMPLAFERGVYYYNGTACTAISDFIDGHVVFDEPYYFDAGRELRAIACCLILVLEGEIG